MTRALTALRVVALVSALVFVPAASVSAERRIALVIGNNAYKDGPLTAPVNDARAMTTALGELGFQVTRVEDAGRVAMLRAIRVFAGELQRQPDTVGLFYFAGHGLQVRGKNFLVPVDADIEHEDEIELQGVDLQYMLDKFADLREPMNVIILDACRNNPFARRGAARTSGLAAIDGPPGTLVAFAAAPGHVAAETPGGHGIYTKNILDNIRTPGIPIEDVFKRVRAGVVTETARSQTPWENTSLVRDFYFKGAPAGKGYARVVPDSEAQAWSEIAGSRNIYDFITFMRRFPGSRYRTELLAAVNSILTRLKPAPPALKPDELPALLNEAWAGLFVRPLNEYAARHFGLSAAKGLLVVQVDRGSAAERGGLRPGDILLRVNGKPLNDAGDLLDVNRTILPGEFVDAVAWRSGKEVAIATVVERASVLRLLWRVASERLQAKEYGRARVFLEYLASMDEPDAQSELGEMYAAGLGVTRDAGIAESWLLKAANQGKTWAAVWLAGTYLNPASGVTNNDQAYRWAKVAADAGLPEGAALLAIVYFSGRGATRDPREGVRWARYAAELGEPNAMVLLANAYQQGVGTARSLEDAKAWYRRARDLGNKAATEALRALGE